MFAIRPSLRASSGNALKHSFSKTPVYTRTLITLTRRPIAAPTLSFSPVITSSSLELVTAKIAPKISQSPILAALQVRNGPRDTFKGATHLVRKRRVGFLARKRSRTGRAILKRRMAKGRRNMSH